MYTRVAIAITKTATRMYKVIKPPIELLAQQSARSGTLQSSSPLLHQAGCCTRFQLSFCCRLLTALAESQWSGCSLAVRVQPLHLREVRLYGLGFASSCASATLRCWAMVRHPAGTRLKRYPVSQTVRVTVYRLYCACPLHSSGPEPHQACLSKNNYTYRLAQPVSLASIIFNYIRFVIIEMRPRFVVY